MIFFKGLTLIILILLIVDNATCAEKDSYKKDDSIASSSTYMDKISKIKSETLKKEPLPKENYLDGVQISYGLNRFPNVIAYGLTSAIFSYEEVSSGKNEKSVIDDNTTIIEFEIWSSLPNNLYINTSFSAKLMNPKNNTIKIMSTLDMLNFREFPETKEVEIHLEICSQNEKVEETSKIYVAIFCHQNETSFIEFVIKDDTNHPPLKFYMKKSCSQGKIPELNVLMTQNKYKSSIHDYEYKMIDKSQIVDPKNIIIFSEDELYLYIASEVGRQILIYPKVYVNESGVKAYLTGPGSFGGIISYDSNLEFEIIFSCERLVVLEVTYNAMVPPFENVTFSFLKNCSQVKDNLLHYQENFDFAIGTEYGKRDVYDNGETLTEYSVDDYLDNKHLRVINEDEETTAFFVYTNKNLIFKEIKVIATDSDKVSPSIRGLSRDNENKFLLNHFLLVYNCKNFGETFIRVVLNLENHKLVEFNLIKKCPPHVAHIENTGNSFIKYFWIIIGFIAMLCFTLYFVDKCGKILINERRSQNKYQEATTELPRPQIIFH